MSELDFSLLPHLVDALLFLRLGSILSHYRFSLKHGRSPWCGDGASTVFTVDFTLISVIFGRSCISGTFHHSGNVLEEAACSSSGLLLLFLMLSLNLLHLLHHIKLVLFLFILSLRFRDGGTIGHVTDVVTVLVHELGFSFLSHD